MRRVGGESEKTLYIKTKSGFFEKYMSGTGLDIGYAGALSDFLPVLESAIGIDKDYPGYDGMYLPFMNNSQDYVYSSHCLEHIEHHNTAISEWFRVVKEGGHLVIVVPHQFLYEKKANLPSRYNEDHKRFYTPASLLKAVEESLRANYYRVRLLEDGDCNFDYNISPKSHSSGQYEITLVIQKIKPPTWDIE